MSTSRLAIGFDVGGSNLRAALVGADHQILAVHKEPVGEPRDVDAIVERIAQIVDRLADAPDVHVPWFAGDAHEVIPVGVGIAAMLRDRTGHVASSPHLRWRDVPFGARLATRLGSRYRLRVHNDVNAVVWGEVVAGAARGCTEVLGVYVGTGIGAGIVCNGRLVEGATSCAGELGHSKVRWDDDAEPCKCGARGCVEAYLGGAYLEQRIRRELSAKNAKSSAIALAGGVDSVTPSHVDQAATDGDEWALGVWTDIAPLLAVALGNALALLNSERLVLGGGVLSRCPTLFDLVVTTLHLAAPQPSIEPLSILAAELGDDAGLVGAAALARLGDAR